MDVFGSAPQIVAVGQTPYGGAVIVTISREQLRHLAEVGVTAAWASSGCHLTVLYRSDEELVPLASFDVNRKDHRRTLAHALGRGMLHIASAEGWTEGATLPKDKLALELGAADREGIEQALGREEED